MGTVFFFRTAYKVDSTSTILKIREFWVRHTILYVLSPSYSSCHGIWVDIRWDSDGKKLMCGAILQAEYIILKPTDVNEDMPGYSKSQTASFLGILLHHVQLKVTVFSTLFHCWTFKQLIYPATLVALRNYASSSSLLSPGLRCVTLSNIPWSIVFSFSLCWLVQARQRSPDKWQTPKRTALGSSGWSSLICWGKA